MQVLAADPPVDKTLPPLAKIREAVNKLKCGKAAGICNVSAKMLKAWGEVMMRGLHAVLSVIWQSGAIPPDWKRGLVVPIWKRERGSPGLQQLLLYYIAQCTGQGAHSSVADVNSFPTAEVPGA